MPATRSTRFDMPQYGIGLGEFQSLTGHGLGFILDPIGSWRTPPVTP